MIGGIATAPAPPVVEARFAIHGLEIGLRSDVPAVVEAVARSYDAFRIDGPIVAGDSADWIEVRRGASGHLLSDRRGRFLTPGGEDAAILGTLDRFVTAVLDGLGQRGILGTHAAVVAVGGRAVLLAGPSGRGKSTLTLALLRDGATWLTDELALVDVDDRTILPYPRALHVSPATVELLPALGFLRVRPRYVLGGESEWSVSVADIAGAFGSAVAGPTPLAMIVVLDERGGATEEPALLPISPAEATIALMRGTPAATTDFGGTLRRLGTIASLVPTIRLGATDPARTSARLVDHVAGLA